MPQACDECDDDDKKLYGCGFSGDDGKAELKWANGSDDKHWGKTCPMYCFLLPPVQEVLADLADYKRGVLGVVDDMEVPRLAYLRVAEAEQSKWESEVHASVTSQMRRKHASGKKR